MTKKPEYSITDLGIMPGFDESRATALNDEGQVIGTLRRGDFDFKPYGFHWREGMISGSGDVIPNSINNKGQIAGISRKIYLEFIAYGEKPRSSPRSNTVHWGQAISENGQTVGFSQFTNWNVPSKSKRQPFILESDERSSLTIPEGYDAGEAMGINSQGMVVGNVWSRDVSDKHAIVWQDDEVRHLGELTGFHNTEAITVNDSGHVLVKAFQARFAELLRQSTGAGDLHQLTEEVARIPANAWGFKHQPYLWNSGQWQEINGMRFAHALNNQGQVVGSILIDPKTASGPSGPNERAGNHAAFWEAGEVMDLNNALPEDSGWVLQKATDINNWGQIVGDGVFEGKSRAFLLTLERL